MKTQLSLAWMMIATCLAAAHSSPAADDVWMRTKPIPTARFGACACVVDGKIYVIGGGGPVKRGPYLSTVEMYDPATGNWTKKANMPTARNGHAACMVNGKIYVLGGEPSAKASLDIVEVYDPATDTWKTKASMPNKRTFHCGCGIGGKIYVFGGVTAESEAVRNASGLDVYDAATDTWKTQPLITRTRTAAGACVMGGKIFVVGGADRSRPEDSALATVEQYDPVKGTWTRKANLPTPRVFLAASATNDKIYAAGGGVFGGPTFATVEEYDPATDTWTARAPLNTPRQLLATVTVGNRLYAIGGTVHWANWSGSSAVEEYSVGSRD